ncbi:hypothetical protein HZC09_01735 [Candidatus Micrarchaeota archaeon]|nr:hypothetical protein [Candidatus Micrarchaeota archaeon]
MKEKVAFLLVPGIARPATRSPLRQVGEKLEQYGRVIAIEHDDLETGTEKIGRLQERVLELMKNGVKTLVFVGHSQGPYVTRELDWKQFEENKIRTALISISNPGSQKHHRQNLADAKKQIMLATKEVDLALFEPEKVLQGYDQKKPSPDTPTLHIAVRGDSLSMPHALQELEEKGANVVFVGEEPTGEIEGMEVLRRHNWINPEWRNKLITYIESFLKEQGFLESNK